MEPAEPVRLFLTWGEAPQAQAPGQAPPTNPEPLERAMLCPHPKAMQPFHRITHFVGSIS